jgi:hypothetical protein
MQVSSPGGDLVVHFGGTVQDGHRLVFPFRGASILAAGRNRDQDGLCHDGVT